MNRRTIGYVLFGLLAYVCFVLASIPAGWLAWGIARLTQGQVQVDQPQGTLWRGNGQLVAVPRAGAATLLGDVRWQLRPARLFVGRAVVELAGTGSEGAYKGTVAVGPASLTLEGLRVALTPALLTRVYPALEVFGPEGRLRIHAESLRLQGDGLHGRVELRWEAAASRLSNVRPLGDYRLDVTGQGKLAMLALQTLAGPLELTGQGRWEALGNGDLQIGGLARAREQAPALQPLVRLLGRDLGGGRSAFSVRTRIPLGPVRDKLILYKSNL